LVRGDFSRHYRPTTGRPNTNGSDALTAQNHGGLKIDLSVQGYEGVGRFVLDLPGEADAVGPPAFIRYLEERMGRSALFRKGKKKAKNVKP
jgi:hypothetical protein